MKKKKTENPSMNFRITIAENLKRHILYALEKHPFFPDDIHDAVTILLEEIGEIAKVMNDRREGEVSEKDAYRMIASEALDAMAVCARIEKKTEEGMMSFINEYIFFSSANESDMRMIVNHAMFNACQVRYDNENIVRCFIFLHRIVEICIYYYSRVDK